MDGEREFNRFRGRGLLSGDELGWSFWEGLWWGRDGGLTMAVIIRQNYDTMHLILGASASSNDKLKGLIGTLKMITRGPEVTPSLGWREVKKREAKEMHRPRLELGSLAWEASILPLNHRCFRLDMILVQPISI